VENSAAFVTTSQMAIAVANVVQQRPQQQHVNTNGQIIIPALLPNSALYQYNEQMIHMHELYEDQPPQQAPIAHHHHRSTDV
jgi:hypothetical protein